MVIDDSPRLTMFTRTRSALLVAVASAAAAVTAVASGGCSGSVDPGEPGADASVDTATPPDGSVPGRDAGRDAAADAVADAVAPGPDGAALTGAWLAFASNRLGNFDVFLARRDGSELHALVKGPGNQMYPSWSPDGRTIAYASDAVGGAYKLFTVDAASGVVTPVPNDRPLATAPAFSPDGKVIVFGGDGPGGGLIYRISAGGGAATPLTTGAARDGLPVWSPDGSQIYFATDRSGSFEIWSVKPDGSALQKVTTGGKVIGGPSVSPDGKVLAYAKATTNDGGASSSVVLHTLATKAEVVLTAAYDYEPAFARSGTLIAITTLRFGAANPEIVVMDTADASASLRLTDNPAVDTELAFRPSP